MDGRNLLLTIAGFVEIHVWLDELETWLSVISSPSLSVPFSSFLLSFLSLFFCAFFGPYVLMPPKKKATLLTLMRIKSKMFAY